MKNFIRLISFVFVILSVLLFRKIITTDVGLISLFIISVLLAYLNIKYSNKEKDEDSPEK